MKRLRWVSWLMAVLLVVAYATTGAHVHRTGLPGHEDSAQHCVACTFAHAPVAAPDTAPAVRAPEPTCEIVLLPPAPAGASAEVRLPSTRGPPQS